MCTPVFLLLVLELAFAGRQTVPLLVRRITAPGCLGKIGTV
jgi:hypothetical protein